jgi:hypothetical protein
MKCETARYRTSVLAGIPLLVLLVGISRPEAQPAQRAPCSLAVLLDGLRAAVKDGSPALQNYMKALLKESALRLSIPELRAAFAAERDPKVVEALGVALATRASNGGEPAIIEPILQRARGDADAVLRAAALRGLKGVGSVEMMEKVGRVSYADFVRDPAPEVRAAAADNLIFESAEVYFGHERPVSEAAVKAAAESRDPVLAARLLAETSMEQVGSRAVGTLIEKLASDATELRAAAARALGGVSAAEAEGATRALLERYRIEVERSVRAAILEGLVRLGLSSAQPTLESLRNIDPALAPEIDAWLRVLAMNLQEWSIVLREKQRLQG